MILKRVINNTTMERKEVYKLIDGERYYQNTVRIENEGDTRSDEEKCVGEFIIYMENKLNEAKDNVYKLDIKGALESIRKVTALGVAAMESHDTPAR